MKSHCSATSAAQRNSKLVQKGLDRLTGTFQMNLNCPCEAHVQHSSCILVQKQGMGGWRRVVVVSVTQSTGCLLADTSRSGKQLCLHIVSTRNQRTCALHNGYRDVFFFFFFIFFFFFFYFCVFFPSSSPFSFFFLSFLLDCLLVYLVFSKGRGNVKHTAVVEQV